MTKRMSRKDEYEFYAEFENQTPQGPPRRRGQLTELVPVRFPPEMLEAVRRRADDEDRSVSNWIRRAVERELGTPAGQTSGQTNDDKPGRTEPGSRARKAGATSTTTDAPRRRRTPKARS
jgi:hypothetical protein